MKRYRTLPVVWEYHKRGSRPCLHVPAGRTVQGPPLADTGDRAAKAWKIRLNDQYRRYLDGVRNDLTEDGHVLHCPATF